MQANKKQQNAHLLSKVTLLFVEGIIIGEVLFVQTMFGMKQENAGPTIMQGCNILSTMFCFFGFTCAGLSLRLEQLDLQSILNIWVKHTNYFYNLK